MQHTFRKKYILFLLCLLLFSGCSAKKDSTPSVDFSHHADGSLLTPEEITAYKNYITDTLLITEQENTLTGTHTGLFSTVVSVTLYDCTDKALLQDCFSLLAEYETVFSRTLPGSELYALNRNTTGVAQLSDSLTEAFTLGLSYGELSHHRFDISVAPLSDLWAFGSDTPTVPSPDAIKDALTFVNGSAVALEENILTFPAGTRFDLGAVAKGWLADALAEYLKERGIKSAMLNLGGNALALGTKPGGSPYRIGITMPFSGSADLAGIVTVSDMSVVTSGIYERYFIQENTLYHHLLDATTGYPANNDLLSVTIVCKNSALADLLSTTCYLLGKENGLALIRELQNRTDLYALFLTGSYDTKNGTVSNLEYHFSEGFEESTGFTYN